MIVSEEKSRECEKEREGDVLGKELSSHQRTNPTCTVGPEGLYFHLAQHLSLEEVDCPA